MKIPILMAPGLFCLGAIAPTVFAAPGAPGRLRVALPGKGETVLRFQLEGVPDLAWGTVFYRVPGEEGFRSIPLEARQEAALPLAGLGGRKLEWYLAYRDGEGVKYLPEGAPAIFGATELEGSGPVALRKAAPGRFLWNLDGSMEQTLAESPDVPGERSFNGSGQLRLGYEREDGDERVSLAARIGFQNAGGEGSRFTLSELRAFYGNGFHKVQGGDLMAQESEFTLGGAGRRGTDYTYDNGALYGHAFAVNSEPQSGFKGMAWPVRGSEVFGGALGYKWPSLKAKLIFLTGTDDPAQSLDLGYQSFGSARKGSTGALVLDSALLGNRLNLFGEYARSSFDKDLSDSLGSAGDQAWRVGSAWSDSTLNVRASYRAIGKDFGSVGLPVSEGDRRGFDGGFSVAMGRWSLNGNAVSERNNPGADPLEMRAKNDLQTLDLRFGVAPGFSLRAGLSRAQQEAGSTANPLIPFASSRRDGLYAGADWALSSDAALTLTAQGDRLLGTDGAQAVGRSTNVTFGGNWNLNHRVRLAPSVSWSKITDSSTGEDTKNLSSFLNADFTFIPRTLNLALNGAYNRTQLVGGGALASTSGFLSLQYHFDSLLERRWGGGRAALSLQGRYLHRQDLVKDETRLTLALNFSF